MLKNGADLEARTKTGKVALDFALNKWLENYNDKITRICVDMLYPYLSDEQKMNFID